MPLPVGQGADFDVDLALVLAIDCSFSVDSREFRLQMEGLGRAFQRPEIKKAILQGTRQRIAVAAIQWSDDNNQTVVVPWTVIAGDADAEELGQALALGEEMILVIDGAAYRITGEGVAGPSLSTPAPG